jgi:hypothetical protein
MTTEYLHEAETRAKRPVLRLWLRAAICTSAVVLIGWYLVYGQDMATEIGNAQHAQQQQLAHYQTCETYRRSHADKPHDRQKSDEEFLKDFLDEPVCGYLDYQPPIMISSWHMLANNLKPVGELLLVVWGLFAGLQWLIRGALP